MKAFLLSAGYGTRLRPLTNTIAKALVPINGKPLLEYWLDNLSLAGVSEFLINTHYLSHQIDEFVNTSKYKDKITIVYEKELLNTGSSLLANKSFFDKEPFLLIHSDNLCFCDFDKFIDSHNREHILTMMLFDSDNPSSCGIVKLDKDNIVQEFYEKIQNPPSNLANGAVYICKYKIFDILEGLNKTNIDFSKDIIPLLIGNINTYKNNTYHRDIGTMRDYNLAQEYCRINK
jgi:mannose-1-phosphate guanylyltransferase